jgi:hypothetical protein
MSLPPSHDPISLDSYEPLLLSTKEHFDQYWQPARALLEKCVRRAMHGEITVDDIYALAVQKQLYIFVIKCDTTIMPSVKMILVLDIVNYPRLSAMNILALAGSDLDYFHKKYWAKLCGWAYMSGVRILEGWVAPGMERIISRYNFKQAYKLMRYDLTEA